MQTLNYMILQVLSLPDTSFWNWECRNIKFIGDSKSILIHENMKNIVISNIFKHFINSINVNSFESSFCNGGFFIKFHDFLCFHFCQEYT